MQSFCVASQTAAPVKLNCNVLPGSVFGPYKSVAYTEDIEEVIEPFAINHHLFVEYTQLQKHMRLAAIQTDRLILNRGQIKDCCSSMRLQLNADKTEVIWFASKANLKKLSAMDITLQICSTIIYPIVSMHNLGVYTNGELSMRVHIGKVSSASFFHLRRPLRYVIRVSTSCLSLCAISHYYYNSVFAGLPDTTLSLPQRAMNNVVCPVACLGPGNAVTAAIKYKLCLLMNAAVNGLCPEYICKVLIPAPVLSGRAKLRPSASGAFDVPGTRTECWKRAFSVAGPALFRQNTDIGQFKRALRLVHMMLPTIFKDVFSPAGQLLV